MLIQSPVRIVLLFPVFLPEMDNLVCIVLERVALKGYVLFLSLQAHVESQDDQ